MNNSPAYADLYAALQKAVSFARGCPPLGARYETCKILLRPEYGNCAECWTAYLISEAIEKRKQSSGYVNPLEVENERLRAENEALQDRLTKAEAIVSLAARHKRAIQRGWDDTHYNEMMMTDREINRLKKELWERLDVYVKEFPEVEN